MTAPLGSLRSENANGEAVSIELRTVLAPPSSIPDTFIDDGEILAQMERDQLARDIADIECAAAALQRAEPALESWTRPPEASVGKPHSLWLLIGLLWLSTALVTAGAVVAIATLAG